MQLSHQKVDMVRGIIADVADVSEDKIVDEATLGGDGIRMGKLTMADFTDLRFRLDAAFAINLLTHGEWSDETAASLTVGRVLEIISSAIDLRIAA